MTNTKPPICNARIFGLPAHIQSVLIDAGIVDAEETGVKLLLAENNLTLTLGTEPDQYTLMGHEANQSPGEAEKRVADTAGMNSKDERGFRAMSDLLPDVMVRLDELSKNPSVVTGIATGFVDLDEQTSGMHQGDLIIVAARPSMGKTTFALNTAEHVALALGLPVLIFSMEISDTQIAGRLLSSVSKVDSEHLRNGRLNGDDWDRLNQALIKLNNAPIHVDESTALNVVDICVRARRMWHQYRGLGLIIVDYLQLIALGGTGENHNIGLSDVSRSLKALAKELKVPILVLSNLGRAVEERPNKRPLISDLREFGAIEQDADVILFIYRDEIYLPDSAEQGIAEIIIGKQRNGPVGTIKIKYVVQNSHFENVSGSAAN